MAKLNNCIFLLSKSQNEYCYQFANNIQNVYLIYDDLFPDTNTRYCCLTETVKKNSSWDKSIFYIDQNKKIIDKYDYFYFIEDDVYSKDFNSFNKLFNILDNYNHDLVSNDIEFKRNSKHWFWWHKYHKHEIKSFNPLCRLSKQLLELIIKYSYENKKLIFHEILFASIAFINNLNILDFKDIKEYSDIFGIFRYRPKISIDQINDNKIYHPVKPVY